jgi:hypothetical protein
VAPTMRVVYLVGGWCKRCRDVFVLCLAICVLTCSCSIFD